MNPYSSGRYPLIHSLSSPTPTSQMGGTIASMMDTNSGSSGNVSREMLSGSTPSTPPPPPPGSSNNTSVPNSMGMSNGANNNMAYVNTSANSSHNSTSIPSSVNNRGGTTSGSATTSAGGGGGGGGGGLNREQIYSWIQDLSSPETRERALIELSKKREVLPDLAPMLWHSFGTIAALLQEIVMIYPVINPPTLNAQQSNRVCNALALLQCVASHPETRSTFLNAHIPLFLYPFLHTVSKSRPFEYLRLTSLGVVGALVKTDEQDVINFLLTTEIIPLCLRIMESGSELSKTVATFILQKILLDETGLSYICQTFERFSHVSNVLAKMVQQLGRDPSTRLLKHVVRCYLRLSDNLRAREALRACLPEQLKDTTFAVTLKDDSTTKKWLLQLLQNLGIDSQMGAVATTNSGGGGNSGSGAATSVATTSQ